MFQTGGEILRCCEIIQHPRHVAPRTAPRARYSAESPEFRDEGDGMMEPPRMEDFVDETCGKSGTVVIK